MSDSHGAAPVSTASAAPARQGPLPKQLLRWLIPHARRARVRAIYNRMTWRLYSGDAVRCNCCDTSFRRFRPYVGDYGHRSLMCPRCGALGRHRVDWLFLTDRTEVLSGPVRLLHIAPEVCLEQPLRALPNVDYLSADYDSTLAMDQVDVTDIHYAPDSFDGVICNHVLQHVDDDLTAMRELHSVIRPGGWALLQSAVDVSRQETLDRRGGQAVAPEAERYEEVFLRTYGRDYRDRLEQAGFAVTVSDFAAELEPAVARRFGLDPNETIFFCRKPVTAQQEQASAADPGQALAEQAVARDDQSE